jgi:flagellar biosynthesis protein FlhF
MNGLSVAAISCDTVRAGGYEQLAAFTKLLDTPLHKAQTPAVLKDVLKDIHHKNERYDQILIDTPGINPFNTQEVQEAARFITAADMDVILVLPAGMDAEESGEVAKIFAAMGASGLLASRIDMARRLGGLLAAAHAGGLSFSDASNTPKVADGLLPISPETLTSLLMPSLKKSSTASTRSASRSSSQKKSLH